MKMQCWGCGKEKDTNSLEVYSHPEDNSLTDKPIPPLFVLDCQPQEKEYGDSFRIVVVCHECFHQLSPDMWIGSNCWKTLNPKVVFEKLPLFGDGRKEPEDYANIEVPKIVMCAGGCNNTGWQSGDNEGFICDLCDRACVCGGGFANPTCLVHQQ
jgi:hypothetical protein